MKRGPLAIIAAALIATAVAWAPPVTAQSAIDLGPQGLSDEQVAAIEQVFQNWRQGFLAGDTSVWETYWAEDGVFMPPGHPSIVGRDAIVAFVEQNYGMDISLSVADWQVSGRDDLAVATQTMTTTIQPQNGAEQTLDVKQLLVFRHDADSGWQFQAIMFNTIGGS